MSILFGVLCGLIIFAWLNSPSIGSLPQSLRQENKGVLGSLLPRDVTDESNGGKRSGLAIYVDYGTGVQYIATAMGGVTPRLNKHGQVMVVKEKESKE